MGNKKAKQVLHMGRDEIYRTFTRKSSKNFYNRVNVNHSYKGGKKCAFIVSTKNTRKGSLRD